MNIPAQLEEIGTSEIDRRHVLEYKHVTSSPIVIVDLPFFHFTAAE